MNKTVVVSVLCFLTVAIGLTGCSAGALPTASVASPSPVAVEKTASPSAKASPSARSTPKSTPKPTVTAEPDPAVDVDYLLGDIATTKTPIPNCSLAVGSWGKLNGRVVVFVQGAIGPTTVTATITRKSGAPVIQTGQIEHAQNMHNFDFPELSVEAVSSVLITATSNENSVGGQCYAATTSAG